jgi:chromate transporter
MMNTADESLILKGRSGSAGEVLRIFTWLGFTCFGGPIAHIAYFRTELVERRRWMSDRAYADLVGLCQFLPGPASSKVGFSIGLMRAGYLGGLAAWVGFTLPSAVLLLLFAYGAGALSNSLAGQGLLHGLKLVAVAVVAQAVWGMARTLCPDRNRASIAAGAAALVLLAPISIGQIAAIVAGAVLGLVLCKSDSNALTEALHVPVSRGVGIVAFVLFAVLLAFSFWPQSDTVTSMFNAFYRSGALVFGGGHVVLPLLSDAVVKPGWVSETSFLAGYGAAQAVPGPLFTFGAYLGAAASHPLSGVAGAALALVAIFLPGILLQLAALPFWSAMRGRTSVQASMRGINAAVVGLLAAALYRPVWTSAVLAPADFAVVAVGFVLLVAWKAPPLVVVLLSAAAGVAIAMTGGSEIAAPLPSLAG